MVQLLQNNYFTLFYIAFMREIPDPFSKESHPCAGGSCLAELQIQLVVVFSAKTVGKQIFNTLKPFMYRTIKMIKDSSAYKSAGKIGAIGMNAVPIKGALEKAQGAAQALGDHLQDVTSDAMGAMGSPVGNMMEFLGNDDGTDDSASESDDEELDDNGNVIKDSVVAAGIGPGPDEVHDEEQLAAIKNPVERQMRLMPYEGTFNDFNDRVIQFGYLVLFSPAFPLAPLLAFINNVLEIRSSGYKMCRGATSSPSLGLAYAA
eukprot:SAG11_NODE_403_length_9745_cov_11.110305_2_plen_261_part_00